MLVLERDAASNTLLQMRMVQGRSCTFGAHTKSLRHEGLVERQMVMAEYIHRPLHKSFVRPLGCDAEGAIRRAPEQVVNVPHIFFVLMHNRLYLRLKLAWASGFATYVPAE